MKIILRVSLRYRPSSLKTFLGKRVVTKKLGHYSTVVYDN